MTPADILQQLRRTMSRHDVELIEKLRREGAEPKQVSLMYKLLIDAHELSLLQLRLRLMELETGV